MGAGNARNSKLLDLCLIEIGATVTLDIEALLCGIEFRSHRGTIFLFHFIVDNKKIIFISIDRMMMSVAPKVFRKF
jgi:hypothetical protein